MINESLFEPVGTVPPILSQIKSQVARHNLSSSIRHKPSTIHFPHECIYEWHSSIALLPPLDLVEVLEPVLVIELLVMRPILEEHLGSKMKAEEVVEVSPKELIYKLLC